MLAKFCCFLGVLSLCLGVYGQVEASPIAQQGLPIVPLCDEAPDLPVCEVAYEWDVAAVEKRPANVWLEDGFLNVAYEDGRADAVFLSGGINTLIRPIPHSSLWAMRFRVQDVEAAVISYTFIPIKNGLVAAVNDETSVWRGPLAIVPPPQSQPLQGRIETTVFESQYLDSPREVSVYLPPDYAADHALPVLYLVDGQMMEGYAPLVEARILDGSLPPLLLVGVHAARELPETDDPRGAEYLYGRAPDLFAKHEAFFSQELIAWAENVYGASTRREERAVYGLSNGAAFASYMSLHYPDIFGAAIVFSQGWTVDYIAPEDGLGLRFYLQVGTLEPSFYRSTQAWRDVLLGYGVEVGYAERVAGHDAIQWQEGLPEALIWVFGAA